MLFGLIVISCKKDLDNLGLVSLQRGHLKERISNSIDGERQRFKGGLPAKLFYTESAGNVLPANVLSGKSGRRYDSKFKAHLDGHRSRQGV